MSARPPRFSSWLSPLRSHWFSDPRRLLFLRVLIGVTLLAVVWAAERYGFFEQVAPEPVAVDRQPEPDSLLPPPTKDVAATDDGGAEAEAPSLAEAGPRSQTVPRAESRGDRDSRWFSLRSSVAPIEVDAAGSTEATTAYCGSAGHQRAFASRLKRPHDLPR